VDRDRLAQEIAHVFAARNEDAAAVYLFGSVARGEGGPDSDVDVAVLYGKPVEAGLAGLKLALAGDLSNPTTREIRFPSYATAGHTVTMRAPGELLTDVVQWYTDVSASPVAHSSPPVPTLDRFPGASREISPARPFSEPFPDMGP
jgi:predicted nucleotidyltransferase